MERTCPNAPRKVNPTKQIRYRRFVFTLNNYTQEEYSWIIESFAPSIQWIIVAKETGTNGTPHLQGACVIGKQLTLSYLKTSVGFKRAHLEPMHGKPQDSLAYCTKQDLHAFVRGELPTEGKRKDIHAITSRIRQGSTLSDLIEDDVGAEAIVKYYRGLTVLRSLCRKQRDPKKAPCVIWLHGPTGSGKTRSAFSSAMSFAGGLMTYGSLAEDYNGLADTMDREWLYSMILEPSTPPTSVFCCESQIDTLFESLSKEERWSGDLPLSFSPPQKIRRNASLFEKNTDLKTSDSSSEESPESSPTMQTTTNPWIRSGNNLFWRLSENLVCGTMNPTWRMIATPIGWRMYSLHSDEKLEE